MNKSYIMKSINKVTLCSVVVLSSITFGTYTHKADAATPNTNKLISFGEKYIGTPYKYGAQAGITSAFDCSSFTQFIFKGINVNLPRTSAAQAEVGKKVDRGSLSKGDLVFFNTNGKSISHVAIYAGNNKIIQSSRQGVNVTSINSSYWSKRYVTARRVLS